MRIAATSVGKLVDFGVRRGLCRAELLAAARLPETAVFEPESDMPIGCSMALWSHLARRLRDSGVPIAVAAESTMADFHAVGLAVRASRNARIGIGRIVRYAYLLSGSGCWQMAENETLVAVTWSRKLPPILCTRVANENVVAEFVRLWRIASGIWNRPNLVTFRHPAPPDTSAHQAFFGCPVVFGAAVDSIAFSPELLDQPMARPDAALAAFFDDYLGSRSSSHPQVGCLRDQVRKVIHQALPEDVPTIAEIASNLAMSERTLRRSLDRQGTSFRELVGTVRMELSRALLVDPTRSVSEIALLLGYAEAGAFSRAFRRGLGVTPCEYRQRLLAS